MVMGPEPALLCNACPGRLLLGSGMRVHSAAQEVRNLYLVVPLIDTSALSKTSPEEEGGGVKGK